MRLIIALLILNLSCSYNSKGYTVMFIDNRNDTSYLLNAKPLSYNKARYIAKGYQYYAVPVLWEYIWGK